MEGTMEGLPGAGSGPTLMTQIRHLEKRSLHRRHEARRCYRWQRHEMNVKQLQQLQKMLPNLQVNDGCGLPGVDTAHPILDRRMC